MTNSFDPVILPPVYSYGFTGGPSFDTRVVRMDGGGEQRVQVQQEPIWRWSATRENVSAIAGADPEGIRDWFLARRGALYGFLFIDPFDFQMPDTEIIGYGDGATTVFPFRKKYDDPGSLSGRRFSRRIVPLTGIASEAEAALLGVATGEDISPTVKVNGISAGHTVSQARGEVRFDSPPATDAIITAGGFFCVPVRFEESTDQGLDISIDSFEGSSVSFGLVSIPFDDPAPVVVGGSPYGYKDVDLGSSGGVIQLDGREAFFYKVLTGNSTTSSNQVFVPESSNYPTGGPHFKIHNDSSSSGDLQILQSNGNVIDTVAAGEMAQVFIREDQNNDRQAVVAVTGVS